LNNVSYWDGCDMLLDNLLDDISTCTPARAWTFNDLLRTLTGSIDKLNNFI